MPAKTKYVWADSGYGIKPLLAVGIQQCSILTLSWNLKDIRGSGLWNKFCMSNVCNCLAFCVVSVKSFGLLSVYTDKSIKYLHLFTKKTKTNQNPAIHN